MLVYRLDTLRFIAVNDAAVRHYGYSRREFLAMTINDLCLPDDGPRSRAEPCSPDPPGPPGLRTTWRHRRKDRTPIDVAVSGVSLIFNGRPARVIAVNDITERKRTEEDLRQLSSRLLRSQDEERRRIARELHDATSQTLAALAINLGVVNESAGSLKPEAREALGNSFRLLETCTREIRTMSYLLHPPMLEELSLPGALRWYTRGFTERSGTQVDLEMPPDLGDVPGDVALTLYRIVQEGLANIYRHSGSRSATIRLSREPGQIVLTVADRGRGIPPGVLEWNLGKHTSESAPGVGITGMKERVRQLGGRLEIQSGIQGTTVTVVLPLRQEGARSAGSSG